MTGPTTSVSCRLQCEAHFLSLFGYIGKLTSCCFQHTCIQLFFSPHLISLSLCPLPPFCPPAPFWLGMPYSLKASANTQSSPHTNVPLSLEWLVQGLVAYFCQMDQSYRPSWLGVEGHSRSFRSAWTGPGSSAWVCLYIGEGRRTLKRFG